MRIALYARYSSDQQSEASVEDQLRLCRDHARGLGGTIIATYADYAISGSSLRTRPQARQLIEDAAQRRFDAVLTEALDRLSRDQEDIAGIYKRLIFSGVKLLTVAEGEVGPLHIGLKGTMNALFLKDLAAKIKRGQVGRAIAGASPGGLAYGYTVIRRLDPKGELIRGGRNINEEEAQIIRRIYSEYAAGMSPRAIAARLNREAVPSPTGKPWAASTIHGSRARGSGILHNDAYGGRLVYNRTTFIKDPDTGRRLSRPNPPREWTIVPAEHLRIVDRETWAKVRARQANTSDYPAHQQRRPKHLFSGLLKCAHCGAGYVVHRRDELGCNGRRERGNCDNAAMIPVKELERRVLEGLRLQLLHPDHIARFVKEYHEERRRLREVEKGQLAGLRKRHQEVKAELGRLIDALAQGLATAATLKDKILRLEAEKTTIEAELAAQAPPEFVELHPQTIVTHQKRVGELAAALHGDERARADAMTAIRSLISHIDIGPPSVLGGPVTISAHGLLPRVLAFSIGKRKANHGATMTVAGEGNPRYRQTVAVAC